MKKLSLISKAVISSLALATVGAIHAGSADGASSFVSDSTTKLNLRYRYELVDQDGAANDADASTLRSRLTWKSGTVSNWTVNIEVDDVTVIDSDDYNSTSNGYTMYPVVADPEGTDLNQVNVQYKKDGMAFTYGRQRINHNDQRFLGGVAWRQNEQTFDGYRFEYDVSETFNIDLSYVYNVNRIFGNSTQKPDLHGDFIFLNTTYKASKLHTFNGFAYLLDADDAPNSTDNEAGVSTRTLGVKYSGKFAGLGIDASYATQSDYGDSPKDYSAAYYHIGANYDFGPVKLGGGYEVLGSDNGFGFITPLATAHKFQGFADKFLGTPANGVEDLYVTVSGKFSGVMLSATWHDFGSESSSADLGSEIDLVAKYKINKNTLLLFKYATYDADTHASDTDKTWLMVNYNF